MTDNLRTDLVSEIRLRVPESSITKDLLEDGVPPREIDIVSPTDRSRSQNNAKTLPEFYEFFEKVINAAEEIDGKAYHLKITKSYPSIDASFPIITMRLRSRGPWTSERGTKEFSPRFMEEKEDPENPGDIIQTWMRRQRNLVEMKIWARSGETCDEITDWLENMFYEYLWIFQWGGLSHPVVWIGRESDMVINERQNQIYSSTVTMQIDTSVVTVKRTTRLRKLLFSLGLDSTQIE